MECSPWESNILRQDLIFSAGKTALLNKAAFRRHTENILCVMQPKPNRPAIKKGLQHFRFRTRYIGQQQRAWVESRLAHHTTASETAFPNGLFFPTALSKWKWRRVSGRVRHEAFAGKSPLAKRPKIPYPRPKTSTCQAELKLMAILPVLGLVSSRLPHFS